MTTELATVPQGMVALIPVQTIKANRQIMQQLIREVFKEDVHYGIVPGTDKQTLFKPGSEAILSMFRLAVRPVIEDLSTDEYVKYRVRCDLYSMGSDVIVGSGVGECSSQEEKYQWRAAVCHEEWEEQNALGQARIKWKRGYGADPQAQRVEQIRVPWADIANTVLKMAKKRAQIDATLTATAASDVFTQDVDDGDETGEARGRKKAAPSSDAPTIKSNQAGMFYHRWKDAKIPESRVRAYLTEVVGVDDSRKIPAQPKKIFDDALAWVAAGGPDWQKKPAPQQEQKPAASAAQTQPAKPAPQAQPPANGQQQQHAPMTDPSLDFSPFPQDDDAGDARE